jgi:hypothetical protein
MAARTSAALRLRGRDGPLRARIDWPAGEPEALLVFIGDDESTGRALGEALHAVTLCAACATHHDARGALEWTADHAAQLGADPARLVLAGAGPAAALAAAAAAAAGAHDRWPAIERLVLVEPQLADDTPLADVPLTIVAGDQAARAYAIRAREGGVAVTLAATVG